MGRKKLSVFILVVCVVKCLAMTYDELEDFAEHLKKTSQLSPTLKKGVDSDVDYDDDETVSDHAWEDSGKFEGDLILNERQRRLILEDVAEGLARNGIIDGTKRWPNNEVIYYIQVEHFTSDQVQAIDSGIEDLARASCVKFRPYKKGDRDAVVIQGSRRGCFSQVGYQGGYQVLNLSGRHPVGRGCFRHGTVVHELLHTLGFYHMQSSPDRDDYVNIVWANIVQPARHNFRKYNSFAVSDFGVGYDYESVLHYSRRAFSSNGQDTIVPKEGGAQIGQRIGLSDKDTEKLNKMYCDVDSDSGQADENASKKTETKKKKNKPFQGQGIGYHQGKAVAFKLLPAPETYKLHDVPSFHVFDYFSKEPQIMSPPENEGFRIGKEIAYSYNPPEPLPMHVMKSSVNFDSELESKPNQYEELQGQHGNHDDVAGVQPVYDLNGKQLNKPKQNGVNLSKHNGYTSQTEAESDPDLIEAFDRLSKIIKSHVYPSQTPDLSIYKADDRYTNHYYSPETKNPNLNSPASIRADNSKRENIHSAIKFINNPYGFNSAQSLPEKMHDDKREKYEQKRKNTEEGWVARAPVNDNNKKRVSFPNYEEDYASVAGFESPEDYRDKKAYTSIYSPKIHKDEKLDENQDDWYQKFIPYHSHDNDYYTDYSKDSSKEPKYDRKTNENVYGSKSQDYSVFRAPAQMTDSWYTTKDASTATEDR